MSLADDLNALAHALAAREPDADAVAAAEETARASLVARVASLPPSAVVSRNALQAFRRQHVAMMSYAEVAAPASTGDSAPPSNTHPPSS